MPGRQSQGGPPSKKPKIRNKKKKRSINAFAIAAQEHPERIKIRQHRLGESEGKNRPEKRLRDDEDEGEIGDESRIKKAKKDIVKGRFDELNIDAGSDSEGNEWRMGEVNSDDDSDLDSDEAFGESDDERFEGFTFLGSSGKGKTRAKDRGSRSMDITLDEEDIDLGIETGSDEDDLGEDAVDLATMLDQVDGDDADDTMKKNMENGGQSSEEDSLTDSEGSEEEYSVSSVEDNDENNPEKLSALQALIANLPQAEDSKILSRYRNDDANEYNTPSDFGVTQRAKLTLEDLGLPSVKDPFVKKSLKLLASESKTGTRSKGISGKLDVPLAKRQQDRLDRGAAYDKSKETLNRWTDTVKHNRQAEHLVFPLHDQDTASAHSNVRLQPTNGSKPFNELEATIQNILEESGLAAVDGKTDEDRLMEFEELETNKMSIEEIKARQSQLRMARELLFREEVRARRIKKIKSKSYRKVHRKEREKQDRMSKQALIEAGIDPSEDEEELRDRRRAEARMGTKHRESRWAKATKQVGRAAWDEDARDGITEMARREEELRKRVEGRAINEDGHSDSELSFKEYEDEDSGGDGARQDLLLKKLNGIGDPSVLDTSGPGTKLSNMKFMLKAETARKKENDAVIEQMRKQLAGDESSHDDEEVNEIVGRRKFGPGTKPGKEYSARHEKVNEFEEPRGSDSEDSAELRLTSQEYNSPPVITYSDEKTSMTSKPLPRPNARPGPLKPSNGAGESSEGGAWSRMASGKDTSNGSKAQRRKQNAKSSVDVEELDLSNAAVVVKQIKSKKKADSRAGTLHVDNSDAEGSGDDDGFRLPFAIRDQELIERAFAGADVVGEFEAEKRQTIQEEDEKIIDNTLPGWGSWVGDGVSKKDKRQNKGRFLTKVDGIKEQDRKDAKLERVIINERRVKKNGKYLASNLPHPFETRQQYERSLRLPVGPEWTTKETFQEATKPRVLMKQGIIAPMSKPLM